MVIIIRIIIVGFGLFAVEKVSELVKFVTHRAINHPAGIYTVSMPAHGSNVYISPREAIEIYAFVPVVIISGILIDAFSRFIFKDKPLNLIARR